QPRQAVWKHNADDCKRPVIPVLHTVVRFPSNGGINHGKMAARFGEGRFLATGCVGLLPKNWSRCYENLRAKLAWRILDETNASQSRADYRQAAGCEESGPFCRVRPETVLAGLPGPAFSPRRLPSGPATSLPAR